MISQSYASGMHISHELMYEVRSTPGTSDRLDALHLQQSPLDRSCGLTCVLMAAMLVSGLPRDHAISVASTNRRDLKKLWAVAKDGYFRGTSPASIVRYLKLACNGMKATAVVGSPAELFAAVVEELERDNVSVVLIGASEKSQLHWVLVTGVEYETRRRSTESKQRSPHLPIALLGLDPESPAPICSGHNWKMSRRCGKQSPRASTVTTAGVDDDRGLQRVVTLMRNL